jgi:hypothetical protein
VFFSRGGPGGARLVPRLITCGDWDVTYVANHGLFTTKQIHDFPLSRYTSHHKNPTPIKSNLPHGSHPSSYLLLWKGSFEHSQVFEGEITHADTLMAGIIGYIIVHDRIASLFMI